MKITLKPDQEAFIHAKLQSDRYQTVDDVIQAALQLLNERDKAYEQWVIETRAKVDKGIASLERGEGIDGEIFVNQAVGEVKAGKRRSEMSQYIISLPASRDLQVIADYFAVENFDVGERLLQLFNQKYQ